MGAKVNGWKYDEKQDITQSQRISPQDTCYLQREKEPLNNVET